MQDPLFFNISHYIPELVLTLNTENEVLKYLKTQRFVVNGFLVQIHVFHRSLMYHFEDLAQISIIYWHIVLLKQLLHLVIVELAGVIKVKVFE